MGLVRRSVTAGVLAGTFALSADSLLAQPVDPQVEPSPGAAAGDSIELVFDREVFTYPTFERRDPFRPLTGDEGPRFEDLVLMGIVLASRPEISIAVVGARPPGSTGDQAPTRLFRLRVGESVGNVRVVEIRQRLVVFAVEDFGAVETRMLEIPRTPPPSSEQDEPLAPQDPADAPANPDAATAPEPYFDNGRWMPPATTERT